MFRLVDYVAALFCGAAIHKAQSIGLNFLRFHAVVRGQFLLCASLLDGFDGHVLGEELLGQRGGSSSFVDEGGLESLGKIP